MQKTHFAGWKQVMKRNAYLNVSLLDSSGHNPSNLRDFLATFLRSSQRASASPYKTWKTKRGEMNFSVSIFKFCLKLVSELQIQSPFQNQHICSTCLTRHLVPVVQFLKLEWILSPQWFHLLLLKGVSVCNNTCMLDSAYPTPNTNPCTMSLLVSTSWILGEKVYPHHLFKK